MSNKPVTIPKNPAFKPGEDYYGLRAEGIGLVEKMGSGLWTDYNSHDPGMTIIEALCYAITDLAFRAGWNIKDLLTAKKNWLYDELPYRDQAFFSARNILTVNPTTPDDIRRLLIDLDMVRNAWVFCRDGSSEVTDNKCCDEAAGENAADREKCCGEKGINKPVQPDEEWLSQAMNVRPRGLYDVLLELEEDPELGDLNNSRIDRTLLVDNDPVTMEFRFPSGSLPVSVEWNTFLDTVGTSGGTLLSVKLDALEVPLVGSAVKYEELSVDNRKKFEELDSYILRNWRDMFFLDITIESGANTFVVDNATIRLLGDDVRKKTNIAFKLFKKDAFLKVIQLYADKIKKIKAAVLSAKQALNANRGLDEDYYRIKTVDTEEIGVCADVEVKPDADIELVCARMLFEIEQYFNPPVHFYSLRELYDSGTPVEEIFNGPALENGFIRKGDLDASNLQNKLYVSDIINQLMDIEGIAAVSHLQLARYGSDGNFIGIAADSGKGSELWMMSVRDQCQPRLYLGTSVFIFYKNGLPFRARADEVKDTLTQLRGRAERPKFRESNNDLPLPEGKYRDMESYYPVQYSFPRAYSIGPDELSDRAPDERKGQVMQLKAYLMVFEHILGNAFEQLAHTADLFSISPDVDKTYFIKKFSEEIIQGYNRVSMIGSGAQAEKILHGLAETSGEYLERRNRFLDHILARFGEQFREYALLLTDVEGRNIAMDRLIHDKIAFLNAYPEISHDRGRAFNYKKNPCIFSNAAGIKKRASLLLGFASFYFQVKITQNVAGNELCLKDRNSERKINFVKQGGIVINYLNSLIIYVEALFNRDNRQCTYEFLYEYGNFRVFQKVTGEASIRLHVLPSSASPETENVAGACEQIFTDVITQMSDKDNYKISSGDYVLGINGTWTGKSGSFQSMDEAEAFGNELFSWNANCRMIVVEHLLLRPKFPGDAMYRACPEDDRDACCDDDPYSFRLTFVMPGWIPPYNTNLEMRTFVERTIRQETPSHLFARICWVGNEVFDKETGTRITDELRELLENEGLAAGGKPPTSEIACKCAKGIFEKSCEAFQDWYTDKSAEYINAQKMEESLEKICDDVLAQVDSCGIDLTAAALRQSVISLLCAYFRYAVVHGMQFERFENAWYKWLDAESKIDWMEEHLNDRVGDILAKSLDQVEYTGQPRKDKLAKCASVVLRNWGWQFYEWMEKNMQEGKTSAEIEAGEMPEPVIYLCNKYKAIDETVKSIQKLLKNHYKEYIEVSYNLRVVLDVLSQLRNIYPAATLHDWDEGNDQNPVRLGKTALGS